MIRVWIMIRITLNYQDKCIILRNIAVQVPYVGLAWVRVYWVVVKLFDISCSRCSHMYVLLHFQFSTLNGFHRPLA